MQHIEKILIANRGEIAARIVRTCREMGVGTVAVFSDADEQAPFVRAADEAIRLPGVQPPGTYLNQEAIIEAAQRSGAQAIHPGYGFLSENPSFARQCADNELVFIGPQPEAIEAMGNKQKAKALMAEYNVPVIPGYDGAQQDDTTLKQEANNIGFPLLLKAAAGGGGKGMRIVRSDDQLDEALEGARREAKSSFGDATLLIEKYFDQARHVEFQILGDQHGHLIHFFERECSVQRRYQKIIEETPSTALDEQLRQRMAEAALSAAKALDYRNAGTVEFIVDDKGDFYFLEVNTRLQVEHPVTEMVTQFDLVRLQIEVAMGLPLSFAQEEVQQHGHAVEARLYAEDPHNDFQPSTGDVLLYQEAGYATIRYDSGIESGSRIEPYYDPMIAKVVAWGVSRPEAIQKLKHALQHTTLLGLANNRPLLINILNHQAFRDGIYDTRFFTQHPELLEQQTMPEEAIAECLTATVLWQWQQRDEQRTVLQNMPSGWRNNFYQYQQIQLVIGEDEYNVAYCLGGSQRFQFVIGEAEDDVLLIQRNGSGVSFERNGHRKTMHLASAGQYYYLHHPDWGSIDITETPRFPETDSEEVKGGYRAPVPGEVVKVHVANGTDVQEGDPLVVINSMKMENTITAEENGTIEEVFVTANEVVEADTLLVKVTTDEKV